MNNNFPKTIIGKIYKYGNKLIAPINRKMIGIRHNGSLYRYRVMVTNPDECFMFDTTWARIEIGTEEVETFKSTREPEDLVPIKEETPESIILQNYLMYRQCLGYRTCELLPKK